MFVNQKGQIAVGLTAVNPEKGASNLGMGAAMDPVMGLGVVEVSRDLHECRHFKAAAADGTLTRRASAPPSRPSARSPRDAGAAPRSPRAGLSARRGRTSRGGSGGSGR